MIHICIIYIDTIMNKHVIHISYTYIPDFVNRYANEIYREML